MNECNCTSELPGLDGAFIVVESSGQINSWASLLCWIRSGTMAMHNIWPSVLHLVIIANGLRAADP